MTVRLLYEPHERQALCGMTAAPQLGHALSVGVEILQLCARRISRLLFEIFPLGQMLPIGITSFTENDSISSLK